MSTLTMSVPHQSWTWFGLWSVIEKPLSCLWLTESEVSYNQGIWMETQTMTQGRLIKMVYQSVKISSGINIHIYRHVDLCCCFKFLDIWWGWCKKYADWNMVFFIVAFWYQRIGVSQKNHFYCIQNVYNVWSWSYINKIPNVSCLGLKIVQVLSPVGHTPPLYLVSWNNGLVLPWYSTGCCIDFQHSL